MKHLYMIGGTMGIGKTTVSQLLKTKLPNSVFLDGDWCWDAHPFQVNEETKLMVLSNISFLLNNFIACSAYETIIFCWVMHEQAIIDTLLSNLKLDNCSVYCCSLVCNPQSLTNRLQNDIQHGARTSDVLERSLSRLPLYDALNTYKIDVSKASADAIADILAELSKI